MQIERVAEPDVEGARQAELRSRTNRQHAAMNEHSRAWSRCGDLENTLNAFVLQRVPMHCRKQTHGSQSLAIDGVGRAGMRLGLRRIDHEEADEPCRVSSQRGCDRVGIARYARNQRRERNATALEL